MKRNRLDCIPGTGLSRREFIQVGALSAAGVLTGCAVNPVTGEQQLMLVSEAQEISLDKENSPHQLSADYGTTQDPELARYVSDTGKRIAGLTHRPDMPYSFSVVNATYVNAYAFPGGTIAATRGIMLQLDDEAQFASLVGHELGHVNARHTAERMSKGMLVQAVMAGVSVYAGTKRPEYAQIASAAGMIGTGALLAYYSRENERQADELGNRYMVAAGYNTDGFVGLMAMLNGMSHGDSNIAAMLFASHPMSSERYETALRDADERYADSKSRHLYRERYMDHTARLRGMKGAIEEMQKGEVLLAQKKYDEAEGHLKTALAKAPDDYAGNVLMAKCLLAQNRNEDARRYSEKAQHVYPAEAQAAHLTGFASLKQGRYDQALSAFSKSEKLLPGNPSLAFLKGASLEGMGRKEAAAREYGRYLGQVRQGNQAQYAYSRLVQWGFVKPQ